MNIDWLKEFTKEELIEWIRQEARYIITPPQKSKLLFLRWEMKSKEAEKIRAQSLSMLRACDGKARDELAKKFNAEPDSNKKLAILKQMKPYEDQFKKWLDYEKVVERKEKEVDKVYAEMEAERKKEAMK